MKCVATRGGLVALAVCAVGALGLGPLDPPAGPIAPTAKPLAEIEPRVAINAANTPGDADSHFRITAPGSYYLAGNISLPSTEKAIEIFIGAGQQVTVDLNGFTIGASDAGRTLAAITIDGSNAHVTVRNGSIRNWANAVSHTIGGSVTLEDVKAYGSRLLQFDLRDATVVRCYAEDGGSTGFFIDGGLLVDCTARGNTGLGFTINSASTTLRGCVAIGNGSGGFELGGGIAESCRAESNTGDGFANPGVMSNCTAISNTDDGIRVSFNGMVRGCSVVGNDGDGIQAASAGRIEGNTITGNGDHGVNVTGSRVSVVGNSVSGNARDTGAFAGVFCSAVDCTLDGNHITNMTLGADDVGITITGTSNLIVRNQLSGVSTYVSIAAGNTSGGTSTTPATAGPWVNITY